MIRLGIPNENVTHREETRVALTPDILKRLSRLGVEVVIEAGAGIFSGYDDDSFKSAGATVTTDAAQAVWSESDAVACVNCPSVDQVRKMKAGALLIGYLRSAEHADEMNAALEKKVSVLSLEAVPRTTRAQAIDALTAMGNLAGYKAALLGAEHSVKLFPMMMTAAGTLQPAKAFIIGAGVAGLQAIATCKRLGARVEAYDVRPAVKEQVESLGATFVEFDLKSAEGEGGYAREQTAEEQEAQKQAMAKVIAESDVVITTAAIPGRPAPKLVDDRMVKGMHPGSVIVDMAAETGGNCTMTVPGEIVKKENVTIVGLKNLPGTIPFHASQTYGRIVQTLMSWIVKEKKIALDFEDEIVSAVTVIHQGEVRWDGLKEAMGVEVTEGAGA